MKKKKPKTADKRWLEMTPEERNKRVSDLIARTRPEDLFPAAYKRAFESLRKAGLI